MVQWKLFTPTPGFSLVEVLITLLIVGAAVMGFVAQSLHTSASVYDAALQVQARILAADTIERIKSNLPAWPAGFVNPSLPFVECSARSPCVTPVMLAAYDMNDVGNLARRQLPAGKIKVFDQCDGADSLPCVVVAWSDTEPGPAACRSAPLVKTNSADATLRAPRCVLMHFVPGA